MCGFPISPFTTGMSLLCVYSRYHPLRQVCLCYMCIPDITLYDKYVFSMYGLPILLLVWLWFSVSPSALTTSNTMNKYRVSINRDGSMGFQYPDLLSSLCTLDTTFFPFDSQHCNLSFGSWAYDGFEIDIFNYTDHGQLSNYKVFSFFCSFLSQKGRKCFI